MRDDHRQQTRTGALSSTSKKIHRIAVLAAVMVTVNIQLLRYLLSSVQRQTTDNNSFAPPSQASGSTASFSIFYNIFIPHRPTDVKKRDTVLGIVREQLGQIDSLLNVSNPQGRAAQLYYTTIGDAAVLNQTKMQQFCSPYKKTLECIFSGHHQSGFEERTLRHLQDYCHHNPGHTVVYMHPKGSFTPTFANNNWRRYMTRAVLDRQCLWPPPEMTCDACGLTFNPMPAFMFRGNFWTARCSYIVKLLPINEFASKLEEVAVMVRNETRFLFNVQALIDDNLGLGRYANEHWVASHPSLRPCDLSTTPKMYNWFKANPKRGNLNFAFAPRFPITAPWSFQDRRTVLKVVSNQTLATREFFLLAGRILQWQHLYNSTPPSDSWVWNWFPDGPRWRAGIEEYGNRVVDVFLQNSTNITSERA